MCHHCVTESVKRRMLSRRAVLGAVPAAAAIALGSSVTAQPALASEPRGVEDLTHELHHDFPTYFGEPGITVSQKFTWAEHKFNLNTIALNEHTGTHVDAPLHFSENGQSVTEIPVGNLIVPLAVIDIREKAANDADAQVTPDDLKAWKDANGEFPDRCCVAMLSGWASKASGDGFRNADSSGVMHFPGFHIEAAAMLIEETTAVGMGVDTLSLDHGPSADFATHYAWLPTNRWGIECLANLERLPAKGATLFVGAPKVRGGTGGPARVLALV
ncbi:cyclase family protein [Limibaculum sp. M0105]|uniref:Cyclase family protein n=1 Tax=Thermohalobaculum xanthum TaxID=2753746 RepID=A0A8J7SGL0_9RHOB|nr:cyclase family protein [Thermohalobaculum xanthum]MBK0400996.1 cyclase family protein [Thermohalobaculum xanthum]